MPLSCVKQLPDCATILSCLLHVTSTTLHVALSRAVLQDEKATHPVSLTFIQSTTIAVCLWFWSIFGLYKPRSLPLRTIVTLSIPSCALSLLRIVILLRTNLHIYQTIMLLPPIFAISSPLHIRFRPQLIALFATFLSFKSTSLSVAPTDVVICVVYVFISAFSFHVTQQLACDTPATELQLQLAIYTTHIFLLTPLLLFSFSSSSDHDVQPDLVLVFATALLSFLRFVSSRASLANVSTFDYARLMAIIAIIIYSLHFFITPPTVIHPRIALAAVTLVLLAYVWSAFVVDSQHVFSRVKSYSLV